MNPWNKKDEKDKVGREGVLEEARRDQRRRDGLCRATGEGWK